ncbi:MAG: hypothetical protein EZS28_010728 [Streblomastix strix]|uniref:Uncharacterized protein n=1 Tax=Streblomastix strix TaxID=222440 RepID=A0A5J4WHH7_9EUKA|nr:MAG: hypothetical protein EZS28_010728 [Streblomastix strix]
MQVVRDSTASDAIESVGINYTGIAVGCRIDYLNFLSKKSELIYAVVLIIVNHASVIHLTEIGVILSLFNSIDVVVHNVLLLLHYLQ